MLNLTKTERNALLVVGAVLLISFVIQWIQPNKINTGIYDYTLQDSLFKALSDDTITNAQDSAETIQSDKSTGKKKTKRKTKKPSLKKKSININTAGQKELEKLPRIGPATAKLIIEYRNQHGSFKSIKELDKVKRIGPKTIEQIEPYIFIKSDSLQ